MRGRFVLRPRDIPQRGRTRHWAARWWSGSGSAWSDRRNVRRSDRRALWERVVLGGACARGAGEGTGPRGDRGGGAAWGRGPPRRWARAGGGLGVAWFSGRVVRLGILEPCQDN